MDDLTIRYYGWSTVSVSTAAGTLFFDPFYRKYCNVQWFSASELSPADCIALTHGHEEHFLDASEFAHLTQARVLGSRAITNFLNRRNGVDAGQLLTLGIGETARVDGFGVQTFAWKHRDVNLVRTVFKSLLQGRLDLAAWSWSSLTRNPFWAPFMGYRLTLPGGTTLINYNEGFNSKMTQEEISGVAELGKTDILTGGMQLDFVPDVARAVKTLKPTALLLYPPHEVLHKAMNVPARPWPEFVAAAQAAAPDTRVIALQPGMEVQFPALSVTQFKSFGESSSASVRY